MAEYSTVGAGARIFLLLLLVLVLVIGGLIWFDFLGLVEAKSTVLSPILRWVGIEKPSPIEDLDDPFLLEQERLKAREEALSLQESELQEWEQRLQEKQMEVDQMLDDLAEQKTSLEEQQKSVNDRLKSYEDKEANLRDLSRKLVGMPPESAVALLQEMKDVEIIDIIRMTDVIAVEEGTFSMTSKWLSDLPATRSAVLSEKMLLKTP